MMMTLCAQRLRALGQALELLNADSLDVEADDGDFLVRAKTIWPAADGIAPAGEESAAQSQWTRPAAPANAGSLALRYTAMDLDRLECEGRTGRSGLRRMIDCMRPSQLLRTVGGYIDAKSAALVKIARKGDSVIVVYRTSAGQHREDLTAADLYELWLNMYMSRAEHKVHRPPSLRSL